MWPSRTDLPPVDQPSPIELSTRADWLISVPPLADVDNRSPNLQFLFKCHNEAQKALLEALPTCPSHITNYPSTSWDQTYGSFGHLYRLDGKMVAFGRRLYLDLCMNQATIRRVHVVATESGAYLVIRVIEFIKCYGRDLHNSTQLDSMWTSFLADPTCSEPLANNDLYPLIQTVTIIQPTLPSPCGFARLLWVLTRPDMYNHMSCNLFDRNGSESPHIQVVWVIDLQDVKAMTFGNSEYLTVTNYVSEPNFFENRLQELLARTKAVTHPEPNLIDNTSTISLPPSVAEQPHKDLTGQVTKSSGLYIGYGDLSDIYRGEWKNPATGQTTAVAIKLIRGVYTQQEDWKKISRHLNHETWVWDQLSDLNVLPFLGISNDAGEDGNAPALITPLCTNGHVLSYLTKNPDADRLKLAVGTAKGLRYLHSKGVIHGDLKPTNILISNDGEALLGDFGRSRIMRHRGSTTLALGANGYQAPELISARGTTDDGGPSNESYTDREIFCNRLSTKTDVYAFAMVALEIFTGKSPFYYIMNDFQRATRIKRGDQLQREKYYSVLLTDARWGLLAECWVKNNVARPEVDMILSQLM